MAKEFIKGNEAVIKGAILAGCQAYYGYPITPASEIAEAAARYFPLLGRTFLQAESEIGSIQMVYGASSAGIRVMTASSGPGISLKQEGISYCAGAELPCVIVDIMRGGPGLGNIGPEQSDYNQVVKGGGHGNYKVIVLAPNNGQEMCDFTIKAFELADQYRTPVFVLTDGVIGQMMEPVDFPETVLTAPDKPWAIKCTKDSQNLVCSIFLEHDDLEAHNIHLQEKYKTIEANEVMFEAFHLDDADYVMIGYGIVSRVQKTAMEILRQEGIKIGLLRPQTLFPFPKKEIRALRERIKAYFVAEMSNGQMVDDVRLAAGELRPIHFYGRMGGNVPSVDEIVNHIKENI